MIVMSLAAVNALERREAHTAIDNIGRGAGHVRVHRSAGHVICLVRKSDLVNVAF